MYLNIILSSALVTNQNDTSGKTVDKAKLKLVVSILVPLLVLLSAGIAAWLIQRRRLQSSSDSKNPVTGKLSESKMLPNVHKSIEPNKLNTGLPAASTKFSVPFLAVALEKTNRDPTNSSGPTFSSKSHPNLQTAAVAKSPIALPICSGGAVLPACIAPSGVASLPSNGQSYSNTASKNISIGSRKSSDSSLTNTPITKSQITNRIESLRKIKETILKMPSNEREKSRSNSRRKR